MQSTPPIKHESFSFFNLASRLSCTFQAALSSVIDEFDLSFNVHKTYLAYLAKATVFTANLSSILFLGLVCDTAPASPQNSRWQEGTAASDVPPSYSESETLFENKIRPLLVQYCSSCHAPGEMKDLDFLSAKTHSDLTKLRDVYAGVIEAMENHSMPPGNSEQPSDQERNLITNWIKKALDLKPNYFDRIAPYVVETYEDQQGNLWLGTMSKGAARYDGKTLTWFNKDDGLPSSAVPSFAEDKNGNLWVGTHNGVSKFDGKTFQKLGVDQGLPVSSNSSPMAWASVKADRKGNIWASIGTSIYRLDGKSFAEFKTPIARDDIASYSIVPGRISLKMEDREGNLWFGTDGYGAFKYDGKSFTHLTKADGLCSNNVTSILEDQQGRIWFTCIQSYQPEMTGDGGVCRYDGSSFTKFPNIKGLSQNDIYTIYETKAGDIWIGASRVGAYRYNGETFRLFNETDKKHWTRNFGVQGIVEDSNGVLWFGFSGGLFQFDGKSFFNATMSKTGKLGRSEDGKSQQQPTTAPKIPPREQTPTQSVANSQKQQVQENPGAEKADNDPYFVESSGISSIIGPKVITRNVLQDSKGGFWLATWNGFIHYDGTTFTNITNKEKLRRYRAFSLLEDHQKNIWLGTVGGAGVYRYDGNTYLNFTTDDGLVDNTILSMIQDSDNNIWFGSLGVTKYDGKTFTSFTQEEGFTNSDVNSMSQAPDGSMWFGTRGALFHYDGKTFVNFTEKHGLNFPGYVPTVIDRKGHLWFGGENGVYHYNGKKLRHLIKHPSYTLFEDSQGNIWFSGGMPPSENAPKRGTSFLNRFALNAGIENIRSASQQFEIKNGAIFGISEDKDGNIWFGTGRGIGQIDGDRVRYF